VVLKREKGGVRAMVEPSSRSYVGKWDGGGPKG
jgi:hypothetical protein